MKKKTTKKTTVPVAEASGEEQITHISAGLLDRAAENRIVPREVILEMMDSIRAVGILQPLVVRVHPQNEGRYQIVAGESRWRAAIEIDPDYLVPCVVRCYSDKEVVRARAIENFQRTDLTAMEEAAEIEAMVVEGWAACDIALWLGRSEAFVSERLALLKLPEEGKAAVEAGHLSTKVAVAITRLDEAERPKAVAAVVKPALAKAPLPQDRALALVENDFAKPARDAFAWEGKREALEAEFPQGKWVPWEEARSFENWNSGYERSDVTVSYEAGSPTWGDLAEKHGAEMFIGSQYDGEPALYVRVEPLKVAELAAYDDAPEDCPFEHPGAKKAREMRHEKERALNDARQAEYRWVRDKLLAADALPAEAQMVIAEAMLFELIDVYVDEEREPLQAYLRAGKKRPFEALARMLLAERVENLNMEELLRLATAGLGMDARELPAVSAYLSEIKEEEGE